MSETELRRLRYRLKTQGMCELDVWLAPLKKALHHDDADMLQQVSHLLQQEAPELQAMMHGKTPIPKPLQTYLQTVKRHRDHT